MTNNILLVFQNPCLMPAAVGWVSSQIIKVLLNLMLLRRLDVTRFVGAGGMPSAHSAFVTALAASMGLNYGFDSAYFAIAAALAVVVMYDAAGVRRAAGKQAAKINKIIKHLMDKRSGYQDTQEQLRELLGPGGPGRRAAGNHHRHPLGAVTGGARRPPAKAAAFFLQFRQPRRKTRAKKERGVPCRF